MGDFHVLVWQKSFVFPSGDIELSNRHSFVFRECESTDLLSLRESLRLYEVGQADLHWHLLKEPGVGLTMSLSGRSPNLTIPRSTSMFSLSCRTGFVTLAVNFLVDQSCLRLAVESLSRLDE
jgi:hypothetical protein